MFLLGWDGVDTLQKSVRVLLYLVFPIGGVEDCTESRPVARDAIDVQPVFLMERLRRSHQILFELVAQVNVDLVEAALAVAELLKVLVDVLPFGVVPSPRHSVVSWSLPSSRPSP